MATPAVPRVGVSVFVVNRRVGDEHFGQVLIGQRKGSHGAGTWGLPGGHLEYGEAFEACGVRELLEETALRVPAADVAFVTATNDVFTREHKHYVTLFVVCAVTAVHGEPRIMEPAKCAAWEWVSAAQLKGWAAEQAERATAAASEAGAEPGISGGGGERELKAGGRELFLPLVSFLETRPGLIDSMLDQLP